MDIKQVKEIIDEITYKDWSLWALQRESGFNNEAIFVYATFYANGDIQTTRKWYISPHASRSEIVQTVLKCILTAEEHEAREAFRYKGAKIFGPHLDVDALVDFSKNKENLSIRPDPVEASL